MTTATELATRVESLHEELYALAGTLPQEIWHWKREEQVWSIAQILGHIAEYERYFSKEVKRLSEEPGSKFGRPRDHETRMSGVTLTGDETVPDLLASIEDSKQSVLSLLSSLSEADWQKEGVSESYGPQTLGWILEHFIADHLQKHIGQIRRNLSEFQAV